MFVSRKKCKTQNFKNPITDSDSLIPMTFDKTLQKINFFLKKSFLFLKNVKSEAQNFENPIMDSDSSTSITYNKGSSKVRKTLK